MRKIKVVVLLVQQLQHGFTKNAKVYPNLTVAHIVKYFLDISMIISSSRKSDHYSTNVGKLHLQPL